MMKKVLVTGVAGPIGGMIRRHLGGQCELSGLDRLAVDDVPCTGGDVADFDATRPAFDGIDTVIHLDCGSEPQSDVGSRIGEQHRRHAMQLVEKIACSPTYVPGFRW